MEEIISFLLYPSFTGGLALLRIIFLFFSFLFLALIIYFLITTRWLKLIFLQDLIEFLTFKPYQRKKTKRWKRKVLSQLETGFEGEIKLSLLEAELLLNETLEELGYPGQTLAERLKNLSPDVLSNVDQVLEIHKISDNIRHDPTYKLAPEEARRAISVYERALKDLDAL
jgi:hypothetical protein